MSVSARSTSSDATAPVSKPATRWRVVDIVVASVLGVASGVLFWAWGLAWTPLSTLLTFSPGLEGLLSGGWLFAGVLGALVIRKPGAALYTEIVAAVVSMLVGTQWGFLTFVWGVAEGLGAEIVLALFLYKSWRLGTAMLAGAGAGLVTGFLDTTFSSVATYEPVFKAIYIVSSVVSGVVIAGLLSWLAVRGLARAGALSRFASGRTAQKLV